MQYSAACTKEKVTAAWGKGFCSQWPLDYVPQTLVLNLEMMRSVWVEVLFCFVFSVIQVAYFIKFKRASNKQIILDHKYHGL